jgi:DNA-binding transcriptional ArsR family regulator
MPAMRMGSPNCMTAEKCGGLNGGTETECSSQDGNWPATDKVMENAQKASQFLKALSHETRLLLLCLLSQGERSVTDLETILELRQPAVSQQLARLRLDGLVTTRRDGKVIYYNIANGDIKRAIEAVNEVFCKDRGDS